MFTHIMVPIDLAEKDSLQRAVAVATDLARHYGAKITLVSVSGGIQARISHSHAEYGRQLAIYAKEVAKHHGIAINSENYGVPDPSVEVDQKLLHAIDALKIDLVVMASHKPGWLEYIVNSHGGRLASHASVSVFLVREDA